MTELQKEKARWIEKYNNLAEKINMLEYYLPTDLEAIKKRYASLYLHYMRTKHIDKPVDWIIKEEVEKEKVKTTFKIIKDTEWDEYQVQVFEDGILNEKRTYFTDDHDDAWDTLKAMEKEVK